MLLTRTSRDTYRFEPDFFQPDGHVTFPDFASARRFAARMSEHRVQGVPASDLYAMQLIDEAMRRLVRHYAPPTVLNTAVSHVDERLGQESVTMTEATFVSAFPPEEVYRGQEQVDEYLKKLTNGRIATVEELIYVFTHNANPAVEPLLELVDDAPLEPTAYKDLITALNAFFADTASDNPQASGGSESLFAMLRAPAEASPHSLEGQLQFIVDRWGHLLDETFAARIVRGMDFLREESIRQHLAHGDFKADVPCRRSAAGSIRNTSVIVPTSSGCRVWSSSPGIPTSGSNSFPGSMGAGSNISTRFPTRSWIFCETAVLPVSG